jgi:hypothetical protein
LLRDNATQHCTGISPAFAGSKNRSRNGGCDDVLANSLVVRDLPLVGRLQTVWCLWRWLFRPTSPCTAEHVQKRGRCVVSRCTGTILLWRMLVGDLDKCTLFRLRRWACCRPYPKFTFRDSFPSDESYGIYVERTLQHEGMGCRVLAVAKVAPDIAEFDRGTYEGGTHQHLKEQHHSPALI